MLRDCLFWSVILNVGYTNSRNYGDFQIDREIFCDFTLVDLDQATDEVSSYHWDFGREDAT